MSVFELKVPSAAGLGSWPAKVIMEMRLQLHVSSDKLEQPGIEPPGLYASPIIAP